MRLRLLLTVTLAVLLMGLIVLALWGDVRPPKTASASKPITDLQADKVSHILIDRSDGRPIELRKTADEWLLVKPLSMRANPIKVKNLLRLLETKSDMPIDVDTAHLADFGLAQPAVTIAFNSERFALGDANPLTGKRYIKHRQQVYTSVDSIYHDVLADPTSFASLNLLPPDREPTAIRLPEHHFQRTGGTWQLSPNVAGMTGDRLTSIISEWRHAQAHAVKPLRDSSRGAQVVVDYADSPSIRFRLRSLKPDLVLEREELGLIYHLFAAQAAHLFPVLPEEKNAIVPTPVTTHGSDGSGARKDSH